MGPGSWARNDVSNKSTKFVRCPKSLNSSRTFFGLGSALTEPQESRMAAPLMTAETTRARILVVDDNESVRKALTRLLTVEDCVVCGEAVDGLDAIEAARRLKPDLIIMDLSMPG